MILKKFLKKDRFKKFQNDYSIIKDEFDVEFYKNEYSDISNIKHSPILHYLEHGSREGRRPTPDFDPKYYASKNKNLIGDEDPFVHYVLKGRKLGLRGSREGFFYSKQLVYPNGVVPSRRTQNENDYALSSPLSPSLRGFPFERVAAIVHAFYPELMDDIFDRLEKSPCAIDVFVSTDRDDKADVIRRLGAGYGRGRVEVRVCENRGRDVGPMLSRFKDVFEEYTAFLHLHTKRSPHGGGDLEPWRDYLYDNLVGSEEIIATNLSLLARDRVGVVFPQHFYVLRGILNWGFDFDLASRLLRRVGIALNKDMILEFPSGTMFWARTAAFKPLVDLNLGPDDFDEEAGQVDGTLAHAIERSLLFFAESAGFTWVKVLKADIKYPHPRSVLRAETAEQLDKALARIHRPVAAMAESGRYTLNRGVPETRDLLFSPSIKHRPRFVLLVPSVNPKQTFGGISTAISIFRQIMERAGGSADFAIVATDAAIDPEGREAFADFELRSVDEVDTGAERILVDAFERDTARFQTRSNDVYFATAWWTANFSGAGKAFQEKFFGVSRPFIYLIQDFEPNFYGWSSNYVLAENTYRNARDYVAIINSEELYRFFLKSEYGIEDALCLPYKINGKIEKMINPHPREKIILFYGRPSVRRNAFEIVCNGLALWQERNPVESATWRILSVGEEYDPGWVDPVQNVTVLGKLTLEQYAYWLNRASIGISLMISPHPSYPPLEMAAAGLMTITNDYDGKTMAERFDLISMPYLSPDLLAQAIENCAARFVSGEYPINAGRGGPKKFDTSGIDIYSVDKLLARFPFD